MPDTDFIERTEDVSGKWEIQQPVNVQDFIKSLDDNKLRKELQKLDQVTLYIILLKLVDCLEKCLIYGHIRRFAD